MKFTIKQLLVAVGILALLLGFHLERKRAWISGYETADKKYKYFLRGFATNFDFGKQNGKWGAWDDLGAMYRDGELSIICSAREEWQRDVLHNLPAQGDTSVALPLRKGGW